VSRLLIDEVPAQASRLYKQEAREVLV
jgi:hypothetical protein